VKKKKKKKSEKIKKFGNDPLKMHSKKKKKKVDHRFKDIKIVFLL